MADRLHLQPKHRRVLEALLRKHLPGVEVWAYGSRVSGRSHDGSDLDLVLRGPGLSEIPVAQLGDFKEAARESRVPFLVEARDWSRLPERFHREIERDHVVLVEKSERGTGGDWPTVPLGQVTELTLSSVDKKAKPCEHAVLLCNYMDVYSNRFIRSDLDFMTATANEREIQRCTLRPEDVVITKDSEQYDDIGVPALVRDDIDNLVCGYHLAILRPLQESIRGSYLLYALQIGNVQHQFHAYANGVTRFALRKDDILRVEITLPPLPQQSAIARVLGTLDDKIEINRRMNETLEAMARALFKSWFVDFDPVRAKMEGHDPGLPIPLADLFPDRLVDTEIGEIPEGWEPGTLRDIASLNPENWKPNHPPENIWYVDLTNTKWGRIGRAEFYLWEKAPIRARRVLRKSDTIVSTVRPGNGSFALVDEDGLTGSTGFAVLRPNGTTDRALVWCAATSSENIDRLSRLADGGAYPAVQPGEVLSTPIVVAPPEVIAAFSPLSDSLLDRMEESKRESRDLAALRKALLPRLISGDIRLREAEMAVEAVA